MFCSTPGAGLTNGWGPPILGSGIWTPAKRICSLTHWASCPVPCPVFHFRACFERWGIKLRTPCFQSKRFTNWAIFLPPSHSSARSVLSFRLNPPLLDPYIGLCLVLCFLMNSAFAILQAHHSTLILRLTGLALPVCLYRLGLSPLPLSLYTHKRYTGGPQYMLAELGGANGVFPGKSFSLPGITLYLKIL